jgi:hypothetical protein
MFRRLLKKHETTDFFRRLLKIHHGFRRVKTASSSTTNCNSQNRRPPEVHHLPPPVEAAIRLTHSKRSRRYPDQILFAELDGHNFVFHPREGSNRRRFVGAKRSAA